MYKKILLFSLPGMGDTLMFSALIAPLKRTFPDTSITAVVMYESSRQILEGNPYLDRLVQFDFMKQGLLKSLSFLASLRREKFDVSIMNYPSNRLEYNVVQFLAGARLRLAHRYRHQNAVHLPWLNNRTAAEDPAKHNIRENLELLSFLGIDPSVQDLKTILVLSEEDEAAASAFFCDNGLDGSAPVYAFHTFSTTLKNMHRKCWTASGFAALADTLVSRGANVILLEGPHDREANEEICRLADCSPVRVTGTSVKVSAAILKRCRALVTNDSGVMHLGAAVGVPCVALFGPTDPWKTGPVNTTHRIVRTGLPCSPCFYYSTRPLACRAGLGYACMSEISVDEVVRSLDDLEGERVSV